MPATELSLAVMNEIPLSSSDTSDVILLQRYSRNGDTEALDVLFRRYADSAFRVALRRCRNPADAEDIVQSAFLEVLRHASHYQTRITFRGWIMSIVINSSKMKMREEAHRHQREQAASEERQNTMEPNAENAELVSAALHTVQTLPELYRLPVWLHYMEGFSFEEVAYALSIKEKTVRSQISRGLEHVRQSLAATGFPASDVAISQLLASVPLMPAPAALTTSFKALIATKAVGAGGVAASAPPAKANDQRRKTGAGNSIMPGCSHRGYDLVV